jgi:hypothetical protein
MKLTASTLLFTILATAYSHAQSSDWDIRCSDAKSCQALAGNRVWVKDSAVPVCPTTDRMKNCVRARVNSSLVITGAVPDPDLTVHWLLTVKTEEGKTGYVDTSNAHLLTFKDPTPAIAERKRRATEQAEQKRKQDEADAATIASTPPEIYEKACILAAAERLPRIPGIEIVSSRAKPLPDEAAKKASPNFFWRMIEIDAKAAGQSVTYTFVCGKGARTPAVISGVH